VDLLTKQGDFGAYLERLHAEGAREDFLRKLSDRVNNLRGIRNSLDDTFGAEGHEAALAFARKQFGETEELFLPFAAGEAKLTDADRAVFYQAVRAEVERIRRVGSRTEFLDGLAAKLRGLLADPGAAMQGQYDALSVVQTLSGMNMTLLSVMMSMSPEGGISLGEWMELAEGLRAIGAGPEESRQALARALKHQKFGGPVTPEDPPDEGDWILLKQVILDLPRAVVIERNGRWSRWQRAWLEGRAEMDFSTARVEAIGGDYHVTLGLSGSVPIRLILDGTMARRHDASQHLKPLLDSPRLTPEGRTHLLRVLRRLRALGLAPSEPRG
jgi:hypothetical protein